MIGDSTRAAIKGIIARLRAFTALTDITSNRIYTDIPQQTIFPYVLVEIRAQQYATKDSVDMLHTVMVHGFSREGSPNEAMQIAQQTFAALNRQESNVTLDSGSVVRMEYNGLRDTFKDADGITWHSVITFDLLIA